MNLIHPAQHGRLTGVTCPPGEEDCSLSCVAAVLVAVLALVLAGLWGGL